MPAPKPDLADISDRLEQALVYLREPCTTNDRMDARLIVEKARLALADALDTQKGTLPFGWRAEVERVRATYRKTDNDGVLTSAWFACNDVIDALNALDQHAASVPVRGALTDKLTRAMASLREPCTPADRIAARLLVGRALDFLADDQQADAPTRLTADEWASRVRTARDTYSFADGVPMQRADRACREAFPELAPSDD